MNAGRFAYRFLAWVFLACIVVQIVLAGMALFGDPSGWRTHASFVNWFAWVPLAMFLLTFAGGIKGLDRYLSLALLLLVILQFMTVHLFASVIAIAALHPLLAMLLFWGSVTSVRRQQPTRGSKRESEITI